MPPRPTRESSSYLPSVSPSRTRSPVVMYPPPSSGDTNSLDIVAKERLPTKIRPSSSDWRTTNDRALDRDLQTHQCHRPYRPWGPRPIVDRSAGRGSGGGEDLGQIRDELLVAVEQGITHLLDHPFDREEPDGRDMGQEGEATGWHARARSATLLFEFARRIAVSEVIERTNPRKILGQHLHWLGHHLAREKGEPEIPHARGVAHHRRPDQRGERLRTGLHRLDRSFDGIRLRFVDAIDELEDEGIPRREVVVERRLRQPNLGGDGVEGRARAVAHDDAPCRIEDLFARLGTSPLAAHDAWRVLRGSLVTLPSNAHRPSIHRALSTIYIIFIPMVKFTCYR